METSSKDIKEIMALYGHSYGYEDCPSTSELLNYVFEINEMDFPDVSNIILPYISKREILKRAKDFLDSLIIMHDINYLSDKKYANLITMNPNVTLASFITLYNRSHTSIHPFLLDVNFAENSIIDGLTRVRVVTTKEENLTCKLLHYLNICFAGINISRFLTELNSSIYIHEIIHTQTCHTKGMIERINNSEILSIFFELLYAYDNNPDLFIVLLINRVDHIFKAFENLNNMDKGMLEACTNNKYFISISKAFNLLDKYINSNNKIKKEIMNIIQTIIDGDITLEEGLSKIEVLDENSLDSNIVRRLILK